VTPIDEEGLEGTRAGPEGFVVDAISNDAPTAPVPVSPIDVAVDDLTAVDLVVENATDPDGDELSYTFVIYADETGGTELWRKDGVVEGGSGMTSVSLTDFDPSVYREFYWTATATDARGLSGPSSDYTYFALATEASVGSSPTCDCQTPAAPSRLPSWILLVGLIGASAVGLRRVGGAL
jgi:hypothetical protein